MCPKAAYAKLKYAERPADEYSIYGYGKNSVDLYDSLSAIGTAIKHGLVDFDGCHHYYWSDDFAWIVPDKFVAFRGPRGRNDVRCCVEYFRRTNVKTVIRLNHADYDPSW